MGYNGNQLETLIKDCDKTKEIIVIVGGTQIPLKYAYIVDKELVDEFGQDKIGTLVIDLDV